MAQIPVYEHHDGQAWDAFTKTTTAEIVPTRAGIVSRVERVTLRRIPSGRPYSRANVPANLDTLDRAQAVAIISKPTLYRGQLWPLYQLDSRAHAAAVKLNIIQEEA